MKTLKVKEDACIGCGACVAIDPDHFTFNDEGLSTATNNENLESETVLNAIESCPTNAIVIEDGCDCGEACTCGEDCNCNEACDCQNGGECTCGDDCTCADCQCEDNE